MAFFTHYRANIPTLPDDDDDETLIEHSTDNLKESEQINRLSQMLGELDCETADSADFVNLSDELKERLEVDERQENNDSYMSDISGETSDIQVGYQVRRSGRFKNVIEKSQMLDDSNVFQENSVDISKNCNPAGPSELEPLIDNDNNVLKPNDLTEKDSVNEYSVVQCDNNDKKISENSDETTNSRYKYVVDRVLGVQV